MSETDPNLEALVERVQGLQPGRRLFHAACGLGFVWLITLSGLGRPQILSLLGAIAGVLLVVDLVRLAVPGLNLLLFSAFQLIASPREKDRIASSTWYVMAVLLTFVLFPLSHAVASILVLALADPAASYLGRRWGRRRIGSGTVLGSLSFLTIAYLIAFPVVGLVHGLFVAVFVMVIEVIPWRLDDNFTVPLSTGFALWLVTLLS